MENTKEKFEEILQKEARRYKSEGFDQMLYWQHPKITECVLQAMQEAYNLGVTQAAEAADAEWCEKLVYESILKLKIK